MKKRALYLDIFRELKRSKTRFFSIMAMIALGAFVFVGLLATGPTMRNTLLDYTTRHQCADLTVTSPLGLALEDRLVLENIPGVSSLAYIYRSDLSVGDDLLRLESNSPSLGYEVMAGRLPQGPGEIALDNDLAAKGYALGQSITFAKEKKVDDYSLHNYTYTIVGFIRSPEYLETTDKGSSRVGDGVLDGFAVIVDEEFAMDDVSMARLDFADLVGLNALRPAYQEQLLVHQALVEQSFADRPRLREAALRSEGSEKIDDGEADIREAEEKIADATTKLTEGRADLDQGIIDYFTGKATFDREIADGRHKILDAEDELRDAQAKLRDGQSDYQDGKAELADGRQKLAEGEVELADAQIKLADGADQLAAAEKKLQDGWAEWHDNEEKLRDGEVELADGFDQLDAGLNQTKAGLVRIKESRPLLSDGLAQAQAGLAQVQAGLSQTTAGITALQDGLAQLAAGIDQIDTSLTQLTAGQQALSVTLATLHAQESQLQQLIAEAQATTPGAIDIDTLQTQLTQVQAGIAEAQAQQDALAAQITDLSQQRAALVAEQATRLAQLQETQTLHDGLLAQQAMLIATIANLQAKSAELEKRYAELSNLEVDLTDKGAALIKAQEELATGRDKLAQGETELIDGQTTLAKERQTFREKSAEYEDGRADLAQARLDVTDGERKLADAAQELADGQAKVDDGISKLADARLTFDREKADGEEKLADAYQKILDGERDYRQGQADYNRDVPDAQDKIRSAKADIHDARKALARLFIPDYTITAKTAEPAFYQYVNDAKNMDLLAKIFPVFFYLIALLIALTTMTRMVDEQRTLIGTYKALGFTNRDIMRKYLLYGSSAAIIGSIIGSVAGWLLLMPVVFSAYSSGFLFTTPIADVSPWYSVLAILISLLCTGFAATITTRGALQNRVATLMRPRTPKVGNRIFLERLTPVWRRLSFNHKVTARNLFRYKTRMMMTILGVAGCTALIFMGFGLRDSVGAILDKQFGQIMHYDLVAVYDDKADSFDLSTLRQAITSDPQLASSVSVRIDAGKIPIAGMLDQQVTIISPADPAAFATTTTLRQRGSQAALPIAEGAILSEKLASMLKRKVGDDLTFIDGDKQERHITITGIAENYTGHYLYLNKNDYASLFGKPFAPNAYLLKLAAEEESAVSDYAAHLLADDLILACTNTNTITGIIGELIGAMNTVVAVIIIASSLLAVIVLYNLTNINVAERIRELSTIKVLGFYAKEVTAYVYRETTILTLFGIVFGYGLGNLLHYFIVIALSPENVLLDLTIQPTTYLYATLFTLLFSLIVMVIIHRQLRAIDMVEALKAVE